MKREEVIEIAKKYWSCIEFNGGDILVQAFASEVERRTIEKCAQVCDEMLVHYTDYKDTALLNGDIDLSNAASGEPRACEFLAEAIRALANQQEKQ